MFNIILLTSNMKFIRLLRYRTLRMKFR